MKITLDVASEANAELLEELAKENDAILNEAYWYAKCYINYGVNVAEKWDTMAVNIAALDRSYCKGYQDAVKDIVKEYNLKKKE